MTVPRLGGGDLVLGAPDGNRSWQMIVVYRGKHCPICARYLSELNEITPELHQIGIDVVAVSADPDDRAKAQTEEAGAAYPVGHSLSVSQMKALGLYVSNPRSAIETDRPFAEPGLFVVNAADLNTLEVRNVIEGLIQEVSQNNIAHLDEVYHDDLQVIMLNPEDEVEVLDKNAMKGAVEQALTQNNGTVGTKDMNVKLLLGGLLLAATILLAPKVYADSNTNTVQELESLNDRFNEAVQNHDAEAILSLYAKDSLWIEQGKPAVKGLEPARELFEFVTANKGSVTHSIDTLFVSDDGTLAVMIGSVVAKMETVGLDATGTYLYVLQPGEDGWKVVTDMWHQHDK
eukprot:g2451.t1